MIKPNVLRSFVMHHIIYILDVHGMTPNDLTAKETARIIQAHLKATNTTVAVINRKKLKVK